MLFRSVLARYHKLFGDEVHFLTGVDEHGQKVQQAAEKRGLAPQAHCDEMQLNWRKIWEQLDIQHDIFFRTTDDFHKKSVQKCLQALFEQGEIYSEDYEGLYCVSEEIFYTEKDLVNGKTPLGNEVVPLKEKSYFFRMSKYQQRLIEHIEKNPEFILPENRRNEILGFLRKPLHDLCISRPKARLSWGIELPFDTDYVCYVWFDALLNYATGVGYQQSERSEEFRKWWQDNPPTHLVGKDILTTHTVYWPTMLMALGVPLPKTVFGHGWWLAASGEKMSKSKGNTVKPLDMKDVVGVDPLRYFLTRDIFFGNDAAFSPELVVTRVNSELANNLGNLLSRVTNLVDKNFSGTAPALAAKLSPESEKILAKIEGLADQVEKKIRQLDPQGAAVEVLELLNDANKYIGDRAPWKQVKEVDLNPAKETLAVCLEVLRVAGILWSPIMPSKCAKLLEIIGFTSPVTIQEARKVRGMPLNARIMKPEPLFPRVEWKAE